ncbi:MAG: Rieske 2Fe-2S domain-containing protein [Nanoarchaeota archaeon]|nr:Rieske 2Fe-2S domain-containing protein [Nanoarchaeota archaeon]
MVFGVLSSNDKNFNNNNRVIQSWYLIAKSKDIKPLTAKTFNILKRKITIYRNTKGIIHALDSRCPHLGADLGLGKVIDCRLQCPFHHWTINEKGNCFSKNNKDTKLKSRIYPTQEKYGYIWIFNGPKPLFEIPEPPKNRNLSILKSPSQEIKCHPHIVTANAIDAPHFASLHKLRFTSKPTSKTERPFKVITEMNGYLGSKLFQKLIGVNKENPIKVISSTIGGNMAWLDITKPYKFNVLFTTKQSNKNTCITNVFFFLPKNLNYIRALLAVHNLLHDDRKILDTLNFHPGFSKEDKAFKELYDIVNKMECW